MTDSQSRTARRDAIIADITEQTGIDEAMIERLVRGFYDRIQEDAVLGPIFAERISDWETHLQRMFAFWSSVALMSGRYNGRPMEKHLPLPVDSRHFDRWLAIFRKTAEDICPAAAAEHFIVRAERIAESLELGIALAGGQTLGKGQRLHRPDAEVALPGSA